MAPGRCRTPQETTGGSGCAAQTRDAGGEGGGEGLLIPNPKGGLGFRV